MDVPQPYMAELLLPLGPSGFLQRMQAHLFRHTHTVIRHGQQHIPRIRVGADG